MVAATAVADLVEQALKQASSQLQQNPPVPLPPGWLLKESRSQPNAYYYYHQETGESMWDPPAALLRQDDFDTTEEEGKQEETLFLESLPPFNPAQQNQQQQAFKTDAVIKSEQDAVNDRKRPHEDVSSSAISTRAMKVEDVAKPGVEKKRKTAPTQVRVLHILKKHKDSRRPSSWRTNNKPIIISREEAIDELKGLLDILREEESNPENLIATFKELASQESDCSSAKRHGDLGFFGRKKMRPEFEVAAFGLDINQLSDVVETSSGAHILLRLE